jgi:hypothetical protein
MNPLRNGDSEEDTSYFRTAEILLSMDGDWVARCDALRVFWSTTDKGGIDTVKKMMMLAAMLALVAVVGTVPALAQSNPFDDGPFAQERLGNDRAEDDPFKDFFGDDFFDRFFNHDDEDEGDDAVDTPSVNLSSEQEAESGDFSAGFSVGNTGDYASQCVPAMQFGNTGNFNNAPSFVQFDSESGDFEPGGIEVSFAPEMAVQCSSEVQQSSAASSGGYYHGY